LGKKWIVQRRHLTDDVLASELRLLEETHGMSSGEFLRRYNRGELGDDPAYIRWSGLITIAGKAGIPLPAHA
jgi:hypothetical protein